MVARHSPWDDPSTWQVKLLLALDNKKHVELTQDLASRTGTAVDANQGRDLTNEMELAAERDLDHPRGCRRRAMDRHSERAEQIRSNDGDLRELSK